VEKTEPVRHGVVEIMVEGLRARIAADLVEAVIERLKRQGYKVVVPAEEDA
jgi:hypothetical protein